MKRVANRSVLYLIEAALIAVLCVVPLNPHLQALTAGGLFFHLTQSLAMLLFEWRFAGMGSGRQSFLGVANTTIMKGVMVFGALLMMAWPVFHSDASWVLGVCLVAFATEWLLTDGRKEMTLKAQADDPVRSK